MGFHTLPGVEVPSGTIAMWHGTIANIPSGWVLCDGTNGTPDLRERFVEGAADGVDPGATGGATAKATAGHIHSQPTHTHSETVDVFVDTGTARHVWRADGNPSTANGGENTGSKTDSISDIRPKYYDVAFIMKT